MTRTIDYYFAVNSPWMHLGHARFVEIARRAGAHVAVKPMDMGRVLPAAGGLPLPQRPLQRQLYRMTELKRWRAHLGIPINLEPKHFRVPTEMAARLIIAADLKDLNALALTGFLGRAVWEEERDISDPATLKAIAAEHGRNAALLWDAAHGPREGVGVYPLADGKVPPELVAGTALISGVSRCRRISQTAR